jgi:hypothetical protein
MKYGEHKMPNNILFEAEGTNGRMLLTEDRLYIDRSKGPVNPKYHQQGDKIIFLQGIISLQLRSADKNDKGFLQIEHTARVEFLGYDERHERVTCDENTVLFDQAQQPNFLKLVSLLEERIAALQVSPQGPSSNMLDLEKLAELKDKGVVTEEEFQAKKRQLLGI